MKKLLALCLLFVGLNGTLCAQSSSDAHNGYWWLDESDTFKIAYVAGFVDGASQGRLYVRVAKALGAFGGIPKGSKENVADKAKYETVRAQLDYTEIRFGQFKDGLDEFYKDYKNKSILVDDAFGYVRDSIRGVDQTKLVQELETLRKQSVSSSSDSNN